MKNSTFIKFGIVMLGSSVLAFAIYNVHAQSSITEGGVLGLILLLKQWFNISPAISGFVLDAICYLIGFFILGAAFAKYSIVASITFSVVYKIIEAYPPLLPSMAENQVLAAIIGGLLVGIGVGMAVLIGGACGGDDALAMSISKVSGIKISAAYMFTDFIVLGLSLTYIPFGKIVFSLITVTVSSMTIGKIQQYGQGLLKKLG